VKLRYARFETTRTSGRNFIFYVIMALTVDYQNNPILPAILLFA
jgi:hypothetical protein